MRQSLVYRRMVDFGRYLDDLEGILSDPTVRFHLKTTAIAFLKNLSNPRWEENDVFTRLVDADQGSSVAKALLELIGSSSAWFRLSVDSGTMVRWLTTNDETFLDLMAWVLVAAKRHLPDSVAALLREVWNTDEAWRNRTALILSYGLDESRSLFTLFLKALEHGLFDKKAPGGGRQVWSTLNEVSKKHPDWTCEAIGIMLRRAWQTARAQGHYDPFAEQVDVLDERAGDEETITRAYQRAPLRFLTEVWRTFIEIVQSNLLREGDPPFPDKIWRWYSPDTAFRFRDKLIAGVEGAIRALAESNFPCFLQLDESTDLPDSDTIETLLVFGFASAALDHPNKAISFLLEDTSRLRAGWHNDPEGPARELIQKASTACDERLLRELETLLLNHYTDWERGLSGRPSFGRSQYALLSAIEHARRSPGSCQAPSGMGTEIPSICSATGRSHSRWGGQLANTGK